MRPPAERAAPSVERRRGPTTWPQLAIDSGRSCRAGCAGSQPKRRRNTGTIFGLLMVAPALLVLVFVLLYPAFVALYSSFFRIATGNPRGDLRRPRRTTATVLSAPCSGRVSALAGVDGRGDDLADGGRHRRGVGAPQAGQGAAAFMRGLVLFPYLVPAIVAVLVWRWIFSDTVGVANWLLVDFLGRLDQPDPVVRSRLGHGVGDHHVAVEVSAVLGAVRSRPAADAAAGASRGGPDRRRERAGSASATSRCRGSCRWSSSCSCCAPSGRSTNSTWSTCRRAAGRCSTTTTIPVYIRSIAFEFSDIGHAAGGGDGDARHGGDPHQLLFLGLPARRGTSWLTGAGPGRRRA